MTFLPLHRSVGQIDFHCPALLQDIQLKNTNDIFFIPSAVFSECFMPCHASGHELILVHKIVF